MPKVSIIIPVYNVEKYLAECLDSVISQTMRDIEIICVNDGSPDRSPEILDEYAKKDSRITIIHKQNGGLSAARNAAYPYIKGEYTLFVDSDDWLELDLCEKTVAVADQEQADMTFFFYRRCPSAPFNNTLKKFLQTHSITEIDKTTLLGQMTAWSKLWRTNFLFKENIRFPEGIYFEDNVAHWQAVIKNPKLAVLQEELYWYRFNNTSITSQITPKHYKDLLCVYDLIRDILLKAGNYNDEWKAILIYRKLYGIASRYHDIPKADQSAMLDEIRASLGDDERTFLAGKHNLPWHVTDFYEALDGSKIAKAKCAVNSVLRKVRQTLRSNFVLIKEQLRKNA